MMARMRKPMRFLPRARKETGPGESLCLMKGCFMRWRGEGGGVTFSREVDDIVGR